MKKTESWVKIADGSNEIRFATNRIAEVIVAERRICIIQTTSGLKACSSRCPHAGGDLCSGTLDKKENIICPVHDYSFSLENGRDSNDEGYFLKIFKIKENEKGVFIGMI